MYARGLQARLPRVFACARRGARVTGARPGRADTASGWELVARIERIEAAPRASRDGGSEAHGRARRWGRGRRSLARNGSRRARSGTAAGRRGAPARAIAAARKCVDARNRVDRGAGDRPDAARRSHRRSRTFAPGAQARSENERCLCVFIRGSPAFARKPRRDHAGTMCSFGTFADWATTRIAGTPCLVLSALARRDIRFTGFSLIKI